MSNTAIHSKTNVAAVFRAGWTMFCKPELCLTKRNWQRVVNGNTLRIRGKGWREDGQFYWDHWHFEGGLEGQLIVSYGAAKYPMEIYVGCEDTARRLLVRITSAGIIDAEQQGLYLDHYDTEHVTRWCWKIHEFSSDQYPTEANAIDALRRKTLIFTKLHA